MKISCIIEIPKNSNIKYEYDIKTKNIFVDRIIGWGHRYPENYGFVPKTLDYDGDPLDLLIISSCEFHPGVIVNVRIVGVMLMVDKGEIDNKLLAVVEGERVTNHIQDLEDIDEKTLFKIKYFFLNYKKKENKIVEINGFKNCQEAIKILENCQKLYKKFYKEIYSLEKNDLKKLLI